MSEQVQRQHETLKTDGCLFAVGKQIFYFEPSMDSARLMAKRPEVVTSLTGGFLPEPDNPRRSRYHIWDSCWDGKIRLDLGDEVFADLRESVSQVLYLHPESWMTEEHKQLLFAGDTDRNALLCLTQDAQEFRLIFRTTEGQPIARVKPDRSYLLKSILVNCVVTTTDIFWTSDGVVYRGFARSRIDFKEIDNDLLLMSWGDTFLSCHFHNNQTHPEGVVISTRNRRTVTTWDPEEYGYPRLAGLYEDNERPQLLFGGVKHDGGPRVTIYTKPVRSSGGMLPVPRPIVEVTNPKGLRGINPFFATRMESLADVVA